MSYLVPHTAVELAVATSDQPHHWNLTGWWGFAVLGCQRHQQSRREWYGLEPRVTRRDEWSVASLALGPFFRVDPVLHPQQWLTVTGWSPVRGPREILFLLILGSGIKRRRKGVTSPTQREIPLQRECGIDQRWLIGEKETVPRHSPQKALLTLQTSCSECALQPLRHGRKQTGTFGFAWVVTCSSSYLKNTTSRRVIVLPISKCKWQG